MIIFQLYILTSYPEHYLLIDLNEASKPHKKQTTLRLARDLGSQWFADLQVSHAISILFYLHKNHLSRPKNHGTIYGSAMTSKYKVFASFYLFFWFF